MENIFTSDERYAMINKIEQIDKMLEELKTRQKALNEELYAAKEERCKLDDQRRQLMNAYGIVIMHRGNDKHSYILEELTE